MFKPQIQAQAPVVEAEAIKPRVSTALRIRSRVNRSPGVKRVGGGHPGRNLGKFLHAPKV